MKERATSGRRWRIGELADATGLTVRTLHHYEHVGLLAPRARTKGHQRLYDEHDVRRIYRIRALRDVGLSLAEIARVLDDERPAIAELLRAHRARVDAELERLTRLRTLLDHVCADVDREPDPDALLATIEAMSRVVRRAAARSERDDEAKEAEAEWRELGDALRSCLRAGDPPTASRPRALALRARARIADFAGGDRSTLDALAHLRRFAPPTDLAGWDPDLTRYLDLALESLEKENDA